MKKYVVVKTQFEGLHQWENCPYLSVAFLKEIHRHIFYVTVYFKVEGSDRELEFFLMKKEIEKVISSRLAPPNLGSLSCEMMAEKIIVGMREEGFQVYKCLVFEDNENGAEVYA